MRLAVKKGDAVRYIVENPRPDAEFKRGEILVITDHNYPFYWAKRPGERSFLFYHTELERVADTSR